MPVLHKVLFQVNIDTFISQHRCCI